MDCDLLFELANKIIQDDGSDEDALLETVEQYSSDIAAWLKENGERIKEEGSEAEKNKLSRLLELHEKVVARTQDMMADASEAMKRFKERSKAIKAYAGITKNRISVFRTKKG